MTIVLLCVKRLSLTNNVWFAVRCLIIYLSVETYVMQSV